MATGPTLIVGVEVDTEGRHPGSSVIGSRIPYPGDLGPTHRTGRVVFVPDTGRGEIDTPLT